MEDYLPMETESMEDLHSPNSTSSSQPWYQAGLLVDDLEKVGRPVHRPGTSEKDEYTAWKKWKIATFCIVWGYALTYVVLQPYYDIPQRYFFCYWTNWQTTLICIYVTSSLAVVLRQPDWDERVHQIDAQDKDNDQRGAKSPASQVVPSLVQFNNIILHIILPSSLALVGSWLSNLAVTWSFWSCILIIIHVLPSLIMIPEAFFMAHPFRLNLMWISVGFVSMYLLFALIFELAGGTVTSFGTVTNRLYSFLDWKGAPWHTVVFYTETLSLISVSNWIIWYTWRTGNCWFSQEKEEVMKATMNDEEGMNGLSRPLAQVSVYT